MPEEEYVWLPREDILTFEEIERLVDAFGELGVDKVRLTGGEPLIRRDLPDLISRLARKSHLSDLALTTNGVLLAPMAETLRAAGLRRITVSLDTLRADRFRTLTRFDGHAAVLAGLDAAAQAGFSSVKIDTVVIRGVNDDELVNLVELGKRLRAEVRFIEYMDVGGATRWSMASVVSRHDIIETLARHYGPVTPAGDRQSSPAERFVLPDGTTFGVIASTTDPFCKACDRSRLTADGQWYLCLYATGGTDLRASLRRGASTADLRQLISLAWQRRQDRGAEVRQHTDRRTAFVPLIALKKDSHLEMHTRGG